MLLSLSLSLSLSVSLSVSLCVSHTITPEKKDESKPSECFVFRKQRLCCHGQHDDCGGVRRDHLVSDVTDPEIYCLW